MVTQSEILNCLSNDEWFRPSKTPSIRLENGEMVSPSYYHIIDGIGKIIIRVSNHATYLQTWFNNNNKPELSLQNLSVIFTEMPTTFKRQIQPKIDKDEKGNNIEKYSYFVIEQYEYRIDKINIKDFNKIINTLKKLESQGVFNDPLRKRPNVKANRRVLTPLDKNGNELSPTLNRIHSRQVSVDTNKDYEIDKDGNIIKDNKKYNHFINIIVENVIKKLKMNL